MKSGGSTLGALMLVGGVIWLYFDPNSLALFLGTLVDNATNLILILSDKLAAVWDTMTQLVESQQGSALTKVLTKAFRSEASGDPA